jgi:site-specific DNA-methyltransferase (adenine-specific)
MGKMPDAFIDLVVTSPPYDNIRQYKGFTFPFEQIAKELYRVVKDGGVVVWIVNDATTDGSESLTSYKQAIYFVEQCGFRLHDTMIYAKENPVPLNHNRYEQQFEFMFVLSKGKPKTFNPIIETSTNAGKINKGTMRNGGKDDLQLKHGYGKPVLEKRIRRNIWFYPVGAEKENDGKHPAIFPEDLAKEHIYSWSNEGDLIYDCFSGSGTTAKMAHLQRRNWIGSEISKEYAEQSEKRLSGHLAQTFLF